MSGNKLYVILHSKIAIDYKYSAIKGNKKNRIKWIVKSINAKCINMIVKKNWMKIFKFSQKNINKKWIIGFFTGIFEGLLFHLWVWNFF